MQGFGTSAVLLLVLAAVLALLLALILGLLAALALPALTLAALALTSLALTRLALAGLALALLTLLVLVLLILVCHRHLSCLSGPIFGPVCMQPAQGADCSHIRCTEVGAEQCARLCGFGIWMKARRTP